MSGAAGGRRPRLAAVPPPGEAGPGEASPAGAGRNPWIVGLALVLALAVGALAVESRRAGRLAGELAAAREELAETSRRLARSEARLAAHERTLDEARSRVGGLREALDGLAGVLAADPAEGAAER